MAYADAFEEFSKNHQYARRGPVPVQRREPGHARASRGSTIRRSCAPPMTSAFVSWSATRRSRVRTIRRPTPATTTPRFRGCSRSRAGRPICTSTCRSRRSGSPNTAPCESGTFSYEQIIADESESLVRHMLRGESDPWMFHQANIRDIGGGQSLFTDPARRGARQIQGAGDVPGGEPDDGRARREGEGAHGAQRVGRGRDARARPEADRAGDNAATVPVTGLCTPGAEAYAGQKISYLQLAAGQSMTVSLADCNDGIGGTGGPGGTAGRHRNDGTPQHRRRDQPAPTR